MYFVPTTVNQSVGLYYRSMWYPVGLPLKLSCLCLLVRCLSDDWQFSRPSAQFLLGDMMKFEVSVKQFHHVPLKVTVDSCVATVVPNIDTVPRYSFLGNNGSVYWWWFLKFSLEDNRSCCFVH